MTSVLVMCYDRQETLDITLPLLLKQEGVEYEILLAIGPKIKVPEKWDMPAIRVLRIHDTKYGFAYNRLLDIAKGDKVLLTQCDMQFNNPLQLKTMLDKWEPGVMVGEKVYINGKRTPGIFLHCILLDSSLLREVGGICELYDDPRSVAHEDSDLIAKLLEYGTRFVWTATEEGVWHIDHPRPDYHTDPVMLDRLRYGKAIYDSRHDKTVLELYTKQFVAGMMQRI